MKVQLLSITPEAEQLIEYAGRVCWRTTLDEPNSIDECCLNESKFIKSIIKKGHLSVIEHASATFEVSGISRACSHQLVRHRLASFSQESQRYVDMSDPEFIYPARIKDHYDAELCYEAFLATAANVYARLRKLGIKKEDARFVLPNATATRIVVTMNLRTWRHFIELRCDKHAQWEIRIVAHKILANLYEKAPSVFADLYTHFIGEEPTK